MNPKPVGRTYRQGAIILAERDPVIAYLVGEVGLPKVPPAGESHFATLVRSIVYQQLAGAAARAIHGRLIAALGDDDLAVRKGYGLAWKVPTPTPKELEQLGEPLRPYRSVAAWYCWQAVRLYTQVAPAVPTNTGAPTS